MAFYKHSKALGFPHGDEDGMTVLLTGHGCTHACTHICTRTRACMHDCATRWWLFHTLTWAGLAELVTYPSWTTSHTPLPSTSENTRTCGPHSYLTLSGFWGREGRSGTRREGPEQPTQPKYSVSYIQNHSF